MKQARWWPLVAGIASLLVAAVLASCGREGQVAGKPALGTKTAQWGWEKAIPPKPWFYKVQVPDGLGATGVQAVSFINRETGWALLSAPCTDAQREPCPAGAVFGTKDGGQRWVFDGPVDAGWQDSFTYASGQGSPVWYNAGRDVTGLAFANDEDGWAYGFGLWSTHDGGRTWEDITFSPPRTSGFADSVQVGAGRPVALFGLQCSSWFCQRAAVYTTVPGADDWHLLPGAWVTANGPPGLSGVQGVLAVSGRTGWLLAQDPAEFLTGPTDGSAKWHHLPVPDVPCGKSGPSGFASLGGSDLALICSSNEKAPPTPASPQYITSDKVLYISEDGGRTWHPTGLLPELGGSGASIAGTGRTILAAMFSSPVYSSHDGGRIWKADLFIPSGREPSGEGFSQVGLVDGVAFAVPSITGQLQNFFYDARGEASAWRKVEVVSHNWELDR